MSESLENIRRMAERGLKCAQSPPMESNYIDIFQHILDEYVRAKSDLDYEEVKKMPRYDSGQNTGKGKTGDNL